MHYYTIYPFIKYSFEFYLLNLKLNTLLIKGNANDAPLLENLNDNYFL